MSTYQQHALEGASPVDLVVALYDGMIRFLYDATHALERGDIAARRIAVKRTLDVIMHLQARLRMDIGGRPAKVLSEFYASIFAQILQASQDSSRQKFEHAIDCIRNVRDAWREVARAPETASRLSHLTASAAGEKTAGEAEFDGTVSRWTA